MVEVVWPQICLGSADLLGFDERLENYSLAVGDSGDQPTVVGATVRTPGPGDVSRSRGPTADGRARSAVRATWTSDGVAGATDVADIRSAQRNVCAADRNPPR